MKSRTKWTHTSLDFRVLHILPRHGVAPNDLLQCRRLEVLLARLFFGVVFMRILLQTLEAVGLPSELVLGLFKELARLLAHFEHPRWR